jgi:hypothetical protein
MAPNSSGQLLDGIGFLGNLFEHAMIAALGGSAVLVFLYLWLKGRLDMDQSPAKDMVERDEYEPPI